MKRIVAALLLFAPALFAQAPQPDGNDVYTRIELKDPQTSSFRVIHDVSETNEGAREHMMLLWSGTQATEVKASDLMTGAAVTSALTVLKSMDSSMPALKVGLARAVPKNGQARIRVDMNVKNPRMFSLAGGIASFVLPFHNTRGTIVLPAGYELLSSKIPAQILTEADGRIAVSYMHQIAGEAPVTLTMKSGIQVKPPKALTNARSWEPAGQKPTERARLTERATQDRDIVYFLLEPKTNAFALYHDYTESRPGTDKYVNVVRAGSKASNPSAYILDTGEVLRHETLKGDAITAARIDAGTVTPETEVVVIHFPPVKEGQSIRLRISETYTHPESYRLDEDELVFERNLGRARNSVVLPAGWYLTASSIPAIVRQTPDGRTRLDFVNGRPEGIDVYVKGRKK
jgi:hypothetical protein